MVWWWRGWWDTSSSNSVMMRVMGYTNASKVEIRGRRYLFLLLDTCIAVAVNANVLVEIIGSRESLMAILIRTFECYGNQSERHVHVAILHQKQYLRFSNV